MKYILFVLCLTGFAALPAPAQRTLIARDLARYRGTNRLLLVFAPSKADPRWQAQNALLKHSAAAFEDRDLLRLDCVGQGKAAEALRGRFHVPLGQFRAVLIGKDGHVARSSTRPLRLSELNAQIDRMPMRREEMRHEELRRREARRER